MQQVNERELILDSLRVETEEMKFQVKEQEEMNKCQLRTLDKQIQELDSKIKERGREMETNIERARVNIHIQEHK